VSTRAEAGVRRAGSRQRFLRRASAPVLASSAAWGLAFAVGARLSTDGPPPDDAAYVRLLPVLQAHVWVLVTLIAVFTVLQATAVLPAPRQEIARRAWAQYQSGLTALVGVWLALYAFLTLVPDQAVGDDVRHAVADGLNNLASLAFLFLYLVLDRPSVRGNSDGDGEGRAAAFVASWRGCCGAVLAVALLGLLGHFGRFGVWATLPGPILAAIAMSYFFSRFDPRVMGVRRLGLAPLYAYCSLQLAWPLVQGTDLNVAEALLWAALALKLYVVVTQLAWMQTGAIQRYLDHAALASARRESD
jgi:succinate dehydrogenase hydrophobic anchor subunit